MWDVTPTDRWEWDVLKEEVKEHGVRNSLLLAPMPTASTAQILGNNECFEPYTSNIYTRRVLSGEFIIVNKHLLKDLVKEGLWTKDMRQKIMVANGSVQNIDEVPQRLERSCTKLLGKFLKKQSLIKQQIVEHTFANHNH